MALQRCISSVADLKPGMTDFLHVRELILGPQLTDDLNDFMSASAAHMTVTNTWMNTHTELELCTVPVFWLNTVLCDGNGKTSVQKLWVIEQMDCGRAGLVQDDAEARMQAGESLVDLMVPMTLTVASMVASWVAPMEASMVAPVASMVASMASMVAPMASMASMVAPMVPVVASMAPLASMVEALDWLKWMTAESRSDGERVERLTHKMCEERADGLTHKICEERADELTLKIDGERVQRLTHHISEERADGLTYRKVVTQMLVDGDGSESGGFRWTKTRATSCLWRTQKKFESSSTIGCVRCEKTWIRMAQVTPSTEFYECALRKWEELLTWVA